MRHRRHRLARVVLAAVFVTLATATATATASATAAATTAVPGDRGLMTSTTPGGWSATDAQTADRIAALVLAHLNAAPGSSGDHTMGHIHCAAVQVVAGLDIHVRFTIDEGTAPMVVDAVVWEQAWLNSDQITQLTVTPV